MATSATLQQLLQQPLLTYPLAIAQGTSANGDRLNKRTDRSSRSAEVLHLFTKNQRPETPTPSFQPCHYLYLQQ